MGDTRQRRLYFESFVLTTSHHSDLVQDDDDETEGFPLTDSMAYGNRGFKVAFTRAFQ